MIKYINTLKAYLLRCTIIYLLISNCLADELNENKISLLEEYLSSVNNISFTFQQTTDDKSIKGWMIIEKPNKIRIEYEEPEDLIIIGNNHYLILYNANDNLTTNLENKGPWNILTNAEINLSSNRDDKNINGFVEEIKEIDMKDGKHLFYKILMKNNNSFFPPIILHTSIDPIKILGWSINDANKTYIKIIDIIKINEKELNKEVFELRQEDRNSGNVWVGPFNRAPANRNPDYR